MTFTIPLPFYVIQFVAIFFRISSLIFLAIPIVNSRQIPIRYKVLTALAISYMLVPVIPQNWAIVSFLSVNGIAGIVLLIIAEVVLGVTIALIIRLIMESVSIAGLIIDQNLGYAAAQMIDPTLDEESTILSMFIMQLFLIVFLLFDVHQDVIRIAVESMKTLDAGQFYSFEKYANPFIFLGKQMYIIGLRIALPIFTIILLINIAMGLMARFSEEFEVMILSFPIRFGVGLILLAFLPSVYISIFRDINNDILSWVSHFLNF